MKKQGWHHQLNGHEIGQTPGDGEGQGSLASSSPRGHEELYMTWRLNNTKKHALLLDHIMPQGEGRHLQVRRRALSRTQPSSQTSSLQNCE